jgi:hypothetical protein
VAVHLGVLLSMYHLIGSRRTLHRATVGVIVLGAILGHLLEIALFGVGYTLLTTPESESVPDPFYHSAATYTSLGTGPPTTAECRLLTAVEALTGLVLITWTASLTFLVMQQHWSGRPDRSVLRPPPAGRQEQ